MVVHSCSPPTQEDGVGGLLESRDHVQPGQGQHGGTPSQKTLGKKTGYLYIVYKLRSFAEAK